MNKRLIYFSVVGLTVASLMAGCSNTVAPPTEETTDTIQETPISNGDTVSKDVATLEEDSVEEIIKAVFLSGEDAARALSKEDAYIQVLSAYDYAAKFKSERVLTEEERLAFFQDKTLEFTIDEQIRIATAIKIINNKISPLGLNVPAEIKFIKTDGTEEGGAAYTRDENIILSEHMLMMSGRNFNALIAHEFFHVYTRYNSNYRADLYALIGFGAAAGLDYPESIDELRISNPDAPDIRYYVKDTYNDKELLFIPIIFSSEPYDFERNNSFFETMEMKMLAVTLDAGILVPEYDDGTPILVDLYDLPTVYENTGKNTDYVIHPEEILADNFALYVIGGKINEQWIIDELIEKMQTIKAN